VIATTEFQVVTFWKAMTTTEVCKGKGLATENMTSGHNKPSYVLPNIKKKKRFLHILLYTLKNAELF